MTWRYVLTREVHDGEELWTMRELYTDIAGQQGMSWTADPIEASGESAMDVLADLARMAADAHLPYLDLTLDPPALVEHTLAEDRAAERAAVEAAIAALEADE